MRVNCVYAFTAGGCPRRFQRHAISTAMASAAATAATDDTATQGIAGMIVEFCCCGVAMSPRAKNALASSARVSRYARSSRKSGSNSAEPTTPGVV